MIWQTTETGMVQMDGDRIVTQIVRTEAGFTVYDLGATNDAGTTPKVAGVLVMNATITVALEAVAEALKQLHTLRPASEWHEHFGVALWHHLPICEPPYCGTPLDTTWSEGEMMDGTTFEDYYTHWSPLPDCNSLQENFDALKEQR